MKLCLAAALLSWPLPQDAYKLEHLSRKGDRYAHTVTQTWVEKWKRTTDGRVDNSETERKEFKKVRDEVLAVEAQRPVRVKRCFIEWWEEAKRPKDPKAVRSAKTLQGKTVTFRRKGAQTEVEGPQIWPEQELMRNRILRDPLLDGLPAAPMAPGHAWKVDEKQLVEGVQDWMPNWEFASGFATGTFSKIEARGGIDCALVVFDVEMKGTIKGWQESKGMIKWQTRMHLSLDRGRILGFAIDGKNEYTGSATVEGSRISIEGTTAFNIGAETVYE